MKVEDIILKLKAKGIYAEKGIHVQGAVITAYGDNVQKGIITQLCKLNQLSVKRAKENRHVMVIMGGNCG